MSIFRLLLLCGALVVAPRPAQAHRVNVFALVEQDTIHAEAYFADGGKCRNSILLLLDAQGDTLATARTDAQGQAVVPLRALDGGPRGDLRVVLAASMGHRAEYLLTADEIWPAGQPATSPPSASAPGSAIDPRSTRASVGSVSAAPIVQAPRPTGPAAGVSVGTASAAVRGGGGGDLARELMSLTRAIRDLEEQQRRATVHDVLGGIGYIMGLMGLYFFLRGRSR